jgi:hypothetical protein
MYTYTMPQLFIEDKQVPTRWRLLAYLNGFFLNGQVVWSSNETISEELGVDEKSVQRAVKELDDRGLIECKRTKSSRVIYPCNRKKESSQGWTSVSRGWTSVSTPLDGHQCPPISDIISDSIISSETESRPEESETLKSEEENKRNIEHEQIVKIIDLFVEHVDKVNARFYSNKTQRDAVKFLINTYGFDEVCFVVENLKKIIIESRLMSAITTPNALMYGWQKISQKYDIKKALDFDRNKNKKKVGVC